DGGYASRRSRHTSLASVFSSDVCSSAVQVHRLVHGRCLVPEARAEGHLHIVGYSVDHHSVIGYCLTRSVCLPVILLIRTVRRRRDVQRTLRDGGYSRRRCRRVDGGGFGVV